MIQQYSLIEFAKLNSEFAKNSYFCGATKFVDQHTDIDMNTYESVLTYTIKSCYLNPKNYSHLPLYPYQVLSIDLKSHLMYEVREEIFIWVCYTDPEYRKNGNMKALLIYLRGLYPDKKMVVDTYNECLRKSSCEVGIEIFKR